MARAPAQLTALNVELERLYAEIEVRLDSVDLAIFEEVYVKGRLVNLVV